MSSILRLPERVRLARERYAARLSAQWKNSHDASSNRPCITKLDRLIFSCDENPIEVLRAVPSLNVGRSYQVWPKKDRKFQGYFYADWLDGDGSVASVLIQSQPCETWLARFRVTIHGNDRMGISPGELFSILELLPKSTLQLLELAFDFAPSSKITGEFIRQHAVFGKLRSDVTRKESFGDGWGGRKGRVNIVSYAKFTIGGQRLELKVRSGWLRQHGIADVFDFGKLATVLPKRYLFFACEDRTRLNGWLRQRGLSVSERRRVMRRVRKLRPDMHRLLTFLRTDIGLKNVRRILRPMPENEIIGSALECWCALWPPKPAARLENL